MAQKRSRFVFLFSLLLSTFLTDRSLSLSPFLSSGINYKLGQEISRRSFSLSLSHPTFGPVLRHVVVVRTLSEDKEGKTRHLLAATVYVCQKEREGKKKIAFDLWRSHLSVCPVLFWGPPFSTLPRAISPFSLSLSLSHTYTYPSISVSAGRRRAWAAAADRL